MYFQDLWTDFPILILKLRIYHKVQNDASNRTSYFFKVVTYYHWQRVITHFDTTLNVVQEERLSDTEPSL